MDSIRPRGRRGPVGSADGRRAGSRHGRGNWPRGRRDRAGVVGCAVVSGQHPSTYRGGCGARHTLDERTACSGASILAFDDPPPRDPLTTLQRAVDRFACVVESSTVSRTSDTDERRAGRRRRRRVHNVDQRVAPGRRVDGYRVAACAHRVELSPHRPGSSHMSARGFGRRPPRLRPGPSDIGVRRGVRKSAMSYEFARADDIRHLNESLAHWPTPLAHWPTMLAADRWPGVVRPVGGAYLRGPSPGVRVPTSRQRTGDDEHEPRDQSARTCAKEMVRGPRRDGRRRALLRTRRHRPRRLDVGCAAYRRR